jgi:lipid-binding SYLF domain-containing protein
MLRLVPAAALALLTLVTLTPLAARAQTEQQALVDRATLAVQEMLSNNNNAAMLDFVKRARGALICPRVFKAGFFIGGEGGGCVLVGRADTQGAPAPSGAPWTDPAFYGMGSGSFGFQIGVQDAEMIFVILTDKGLRALLDSQFKFGANLGIAIATIGAGVQGSTTAALRADIVAFAQASGLYAGISLEGSILSARSEWNQTYYGQPLSPQQIVLNAQGQNPGAEPLKEMLARFSNG